MNVVLSCHAFKAGGDGQHSSCFLNLRQIRCSRYFLYQWLMCVIVTIFRLKSKYRTIPSFWQAWCWRHNSSWTLRRADYSCSCSLLWLVKSESLSPRRGASSDCGGRVAANTFNKLLRTADRGWSSSLGLGRRANNFPPQKNYMFTERFTKPWTCNVPLVQRSRWENIIKMDILEVGWGAWSGLILLGIRAGGGRLWMR